MTDDLEGVWDDLDDASDQRGSSQEGEVRER